MRRLQNLRGVLDDLEGAGAAVLVEGVEDDIFLRDVHHRLRVVVPHAERGRDGVGQERGLGCTGLLLFGKGSFV